MGLVVEMERILVVTRALSCPSRLAVLRTLGERGCSVTDTARLTGLAVSTTAFHLDHLVRAGLATKTPRGRKAIYKWTRARWQLVCMRPPAPTTPTMPEEREPS